MGRKRTKRNLKKYAIVLLVLGIFFILAGWKTPTIENINHTIVSKIIADFHITDSHTVKENKQIKENVVEQILLDPTKLNILFLDVGQADAACIICNNKTMLIDAGNQKDGELIVNGLQALGIQKIDSLVGTHIHEDHIGGMQDIVNNFEIGEIYLPYNTTTTSTYYEKLLTAIADKDLTIQEVTVGDNIPLGEANLEVMAVDNTEPENQNLASIVLQMQYKNMKYLFMGDAETENEKQRQWQDIDVLKVGHHGSHTSSSEKFLSQVLPEVAIISVGEGNSYGLPKDKILKRLEKINCKIYRTDIDGTIQIVSDGNENTINKINISFDGN